VRWLYVVCWLIAAAFLGAAQANAHGDDGDHHDAEHHDDTGHVHGPDHNPADHSHPFGEDPFHELAAHGTVDVAARCETANERVPSSVALAFLLMHVRAEGIALPPPVPPPLG
jgi:hypothetical protein